MAKNVEKVWVAEQKKKAEDERFEQLKKQIEEEKQVAELRELQASHGNKSALTSKVDWMYDGPMAGNSPSRRIVLNTRAQLIWIGELPPCALLLLDRYGDKCGGIFVG
jgi:hypothetical protein